MYVEGFSKNDPDHSPEDRELANHTSVARPHAILSSTKEMKPHQDVVCWIHFGQGTKQGLRFWHARYHAIIFEKSVPADCIEKWYAFKETKLYIRECPRLVQPLRWFSKMFGN